MLPVKKQEVWQGQPGLLGLSQQPSPRSSVLVAGMVPLRGLHPGPTQFHGGRLLSTNPNCTGKEAGRNQVPTICFVSLPLHSIGFLPAPSPPMKQQEPFSYQSLQPCRQAGLACELCPYTLSSQAIKDGFLFPLHEPQVPEL